MSASPLPLHSSRIWLISGVIAAILAIACVLAVLFRTTLATVLLSQMLANRGMHSEVVVDSLGFGGATAHGRLNQPGLQLSLGRVTVRFDPRYWLPHVAAVTIKQPTVVIDLRGGRQPGSQGGSGSLGSIDVDVSQARIIALTDAGRVEIVGDAHLSGGKPQTISAELLPARLRSGAMSADIQSGRLSGVAGPQGMHVQLDVSGNMSFGHQLQLERTDLKLDVPALTWNDNLAADTPSATLSLTVAGRAPWSAEAQLSAVHIDTSQASGSAEIAANVKGSLPPDVTQPVLDKLPLLAGDRRTTREIRDALQTLTARVGFSWRMAHGEQDVQINQPAEFTGGQTLALRVMPSAVHVAGSTVSGSLAMSLRAPGVPQLNLELPSFTAQAQALNASFALNGRASLGALRDGTIVARGAIQTKNGVTQVTLQHCADLTLGGYAAKRGRLLSNLSGTLCAHGGKPVLSLSGTGWTLEGDAKAVNAALPSAALQISRGDAQLSIRGTGATPRDGTIRLAAMISDASKKQRLAPEKITGTVTIADATAHANLGLSAGPHATPIGTISAIHHLNTGAGSATLDFPAIAFSPQGLQPAQILPMLAALSQADGTAKFSGQVKWTAKHITSGGRLDVEALRFSSPLGLAQQLSTHMAFASLVPLKTVPDQRIAIERVNWVQPLTQSVTLVTLTPTLLRVTETRTEVAGGEITVTTLDVPLQPGATVRGIVHISHLALGKLIAASNLGDKLKLEGSVSGSLPFSFGPNGLRFTNGRIEADGPGRLSINHTLWGKGETNSVEKAAYGALENLSFQSLSATVESVPGGRLRAVFHVVGYDDGPGTPQAEFSLSDLLTGKAFQKEIPIPRGTAINLTLDTSLNFDELLRGYQETWSQMKAGVSP